MATAIERRKEEHIRINLEEDVQAHVLSAGFERVQFVHNALPEIDFDDIGTSLAFLGKRLQVPILISSMTGGAAVGERFNVMLAIAAETFGCAMGVGSERAAIEDGSLASTFQVRRFAPTIPLFANLGAIQLNYGYGVDECWRAVEMIEADALILHLNPLQEVLQEHGDTRFGGLLAKIEKVCAALPVPVIVKEIGFGISGEVASQLADAGVAAIDVGGAGGTSWSAVEQYRASDPAKSRLASIFRDWGIPTATCLRMVRAACPDVPVIASGGLRNGLDLAKAIALGASLGGFAGPLLRAAAVGEAHLHTLLESIAAELRLAMFCTGSRDLASLRVAALLTSGAETR